jgi:hypothetical protein
MPSVTAVAPARNDERADRRDNIRNSSSLLLSAGAAIKLVVEPFERTRVVGDRAVTPPSEVNALAPLQTMKAKR